MTSRVFRLGQQGLSRHRSSQYRIWYRSQGPPSRLGANEKNTCRDISRIGWPWRLRVLLTSSLRKGRIEAR